MVIGYVLKQPVAVIMYVIVVVPTDTPVTTPVPAPTVTLPLLLLHVPPDAKSVNVTLAAVQTVVEPPMPDGNALTVTGCISRHPEME